MKCDHCGLVFDEEHARNGCAGCPMNRSCRKIKCPRCSYEMMPMPEFRLGKLMQKWRDRIWKK